MLHSIFTHSRTSTFIMNKECQIISSRIKNIDFNQNYKEVGEERLEVQEPFQAP